ncbi:hypothetical protein ACFOQM_22845 [Paenibacillus sp. GCM10012307]|uniref:Uncharacterized protein n=1 Tax=Paenibacillus roseus TaxID=2798579 RepID=A0A934J6Z7_9BACL|nr:hypothetical protein [Paenibacillus roseus]MBJ6364065.1 hypothetical protein [Paenibacillus roseus]
MKGLVVLMVLLLVGLWIYGKFGASETSQALSMPAGHAAEENSPANLSNKS